MGDWVDRINASVIPHSWGHLWASFRYHLTEPDEQSEKCRKGGLNVVSSPLGDLLPTMGSWTCFGVGAANTPFPLVPCWLLETPTQGWRLASNARPLSPVFPPESGVLSQMDRPPSIGSHLSSEARTSRPTHRSGASWKLMPARGKQEQTKQTVLDFSFSTFSSRHHLVWFCHWSIPGFLLLHGVGRTCSQAQVNYNGFIG